MSDQERSAPSSAEGSSLTPFRYSAFTVLWLATVVSNIGTWMQNAAAGWLMTSLDPDPFIVSLVQVARLPAAVPVRAARPAHLPTSSTAGASVIAEIAITVLSAVFGAGLARAGDPVALAAVHVPDRAAAALLMASPWQSVVPQLVPRQHLAAAVAPTASASMSAARSVPRSAVSSSRRARYCGAVLDQCADETRHHRRAHLVAPAETTPRTGSRGAFHQRDRALACAMPAIIRICAPRYTRSGIFHFCERLLGAAAACCAQSGGGWPRALRPHARRHRRGRRGRRLRLALAQAPCSAPTGWSSRGPSARAIALVLFALARQPSAALAASLIAGISWIAVLATINVSAQVALPGWVRGRACRSSAPSCSAR